MSRVVRVCRYGVCIIMVACEKISLSSHACLAFSLQTTAFRAVSCAIIWARLLALVASLLIVRLHHYSAVPACARCKPACQCEASRPWQRMGQNTHTRASMHLRSCLGVGGRAARFSRSRCECCCRCAGVLQPPATRGAGTSHHKVFAELLRVLLQVRFSPLRQGELGQAAAGHRRRSQPGGSWLHTGGS